MTNAGQARAAAVAGTMYLVTMVTSVFGQGYVRSSLLVRGDAAQTARNIMGSETLFRTGVLSDLATFAGVVVLTWALYVLLKPVDRDLALLAAFWRLAEAVTHIVATLNSLLALSLLGGADYLKTFEVTQLQSLARLALNAQGAGVSAGFLFLGLGSSLFSYLLLRSRYVPQPLAGWGIIASLLLLTYASATIVLPGATQVLQMIAFVPMFTYEITLGVWLLVRVLRTGSRPASAA